MDSNTLGKITELEVLLYVIKKGYSVSIPYGDKDRYDQIWDINNRLYKIQIKTSRWHDETHSALEFNTRSSYVKSSGNIAKQYTSDEIDYFATIFQGQVYVVPVEECGKTTKILRFQTLLKSPNINWASNYTFENIFHITII